MTGPTGVKPTPPTAEDLAERLGPSNVLWTQMRSTIQTRFAPVTERWVYGGAKYGWSCRLERGKKGIVYMFPDSGHFRVGLALPDAARDAALASDLPESILEALATATKAIEGWPVRMPVRTEADLAVAIRLAEIKATS
jgi:hypothetical protein